MHRNLSSYRHQKRISFRCQVLARIPNNRHSRMHRLSLRRQRLCVSYAGRIQFLLLLEHSRTLSAARACPQRLVSQKAEEISRLLEI